MECHAVILAGGRGERFWPLSRFDHPKQLIRLLGDTTLLGSTLDRLTLQVPPERIWMVAGADLRARILDSCPGMRADRVIWEPVARNTAAAVGAAAEAILARGTDAAMLVLPSDHWIPDAASFWQTVAVGEAVLAAGIPLVTFGLRPDYPETGYGYVERGDPVDRISGAFRARRFHEKPSRERAEEYLRAGTFYWNSGIFLFRASAVAEGLRRHLPEMAPALDRLRRDLRRPTSVESPGAGDASTGADMEAWSAYFQHSPAISIDHGLMEKASAVAVVEAGFAWSDLGSWTSWSEHQPEGTGGNRTRGEVLLRDARDNILYSEDGGLVALLGVKDLIVVRVKDATLVCHRDRAQEVRRLVQEGKADERLRRFF